jgi:two-component system chemotaxis response regulator CheB
MSGKLRVIVADDTVTFRMILKNIIDSFENCQCIGTAPNGKIAVQKIKKEKPDLVIMDVEMPEVDGPQALKLIRNFDREVPVVMLSSFNMDNARKVLSALENGALDFITKPVAPDPIEAEKELKGMLKPIINMVEVRKIVKDAKTAGSSQTPRVIDIEKPVSPQAVAPEKKPITMRPPQKVEIVLIGISTGGPKALAVVISALPANLTCPVLIVQHMPPMFTKSLAERLDNLSSLTVIEANEGDIPIPGSVYIAPGGRHMILRKSYQGTRLKHELHLVDTPPVNSCRPSVDVLFNSVARTMDGNILAVIMTGMGNDGANGVQVLKEKGVYCIIQDEATAVVWGMPQEVFTRGLANEILPLDQIGPRISQIVMKRL